MRVISYTRFSSGKQRLGHSLERQVTLAREWCERQGMALDETLRLHDAGLSGWSGKNATHGALAALLKLIEEGRIEPGTVLIIEALDRLTRQALTVAITMLINIVEAGIEIVTLVDSRRYSRESLQNPAEFMLSVMLLSRGYEESARKSDLVRKAYEKNRVEGKQQIFGTAPGWLRRKDKFSPWELIPERAEVVRRVFELCAAGYGSSEIAKKANAECWPVPTRLGEKRKGWNAGMALKIIHSRSAIGEHEHRNRTHEANSRHWEGESRGIVVRNYYPAVVSEELFYRAQAAISKRKKPERRDAHYWNIWAGLMQCGECGGGVQRKTDLVTRTFGQMKCRNSTAGLCTARSMPIKQTDATLLLDIAAVAGAELTSVTDYGALIDAELSRLATVDEAAERMAEAIASGVALPALLNKARELAQEREAIEQRIEAHREAAAAQTASLLDTQFADELIPHLYVKDEESKAIRAEANAKLRRLIERIDVHFNDYALVHYSNSTRQTIPLSEEAKALRAMVYNEDAARRLELLES